MKLTDYLKQSDESASEFARRATPPLSRATISRLCSGERNPSTALVIEIRKMTGGKVDLPDWNVKRRQRQC